MLKYEDEALSKGYSFIIGIDEAGRGPLAGPVVASAVFLKTRTFQNKIRDSKKLTPKQRDKAFDEIAANAVIGIGRIDQDVIDEINILNATYKAMDLAVQNLIETLAAQENTSDFKDKICLLVDGHSFKTDLPYLCRPIVGGDDVSLSIASASIIAKVSRDRMMKEYDEVYPQYGFKQHKGYGTQKHRDAIKEHGPSKIHRRSFLKSYDYTTA